MKYLSLFYSFMFLSYTIGAVEGTMFNDVRDILKEEQDSHISQYTFVDESGNNELLYAQDLVFRNIPNGWEDGVRNLFLVRVFPKTSKTNGSSKKSQHKSVEEILMFDIMKAQWEEGVWVKENVEVDFIVGHPFMTEDGSKIFFTSDMKGSLGGSDIFMAEKINGIWSDPISLGYFTNTKENEYFPFVEDNHLRYISKGKVTYIELNQFIHYISKANQTKSATPNKTSNTVIPAPTKNVPSVSSPAKGDVITYKIQLGLFRLPNWNTLNSEFSQYGKLESSVSNDITSVRLGEFTNLDQVDDILTEVRKVIGFSSAFVVAYKNGRIFSIDEARKLHQTSKNSHK